MVLVLVTTWFCCLLSFLCCLNYPLLEKEDDWASFMAETAVLSEDWPPKYLSHQWSFRILYRRIYRRMITAVREWVWSCASAAPCFVFYRSDESVNIGIVSDLLWPLWHTLSAVAAGWSRWTPRKLIQTPMPLLLPWLDQDVSSTHSGSSPL